MKIKILTYNYKDMLGYAFTNKTNINHPKKIIVNYDNKTVGFAILEKLEDGLYADVEFIEHFNPAGMFPSVNFYSNRETPPNKFPKRLLHINITDMQVSHTINTDPDIKPI